MPVLSIVNVEVLPLGIPERLKDAAALDIVNRPPEHLDFAPTRQAVLVRGTIQRMSLDRHRDLTANAANHFTSASRSIVNSHNPRAGFWPDVSVVDVSIKL